MKNKRLIRIIAIIFVLVTGMNSYSDLVICRHENGNTNIVTGEFHDSVHDGKVSNEEQSCSIHEVEDCHTCIDIPIQIKNITILISRISLKEKINSVAYLNSGINRVSFISVSGRFSDKFLDLPVFKIFAKVVLLI